MEESNILNNIKSLHMTQMPLSATDIYIILHLVYKHCVMVLNPDPFIRVEMELELRDSWKSQSRQVN